MTNRDIAVTDLGSNPFLRVANHFPWNAKGSDGVGTDIPDGPPRDFSIPLSSFKNSNGQSLSFPAGSASILTTDTGHCPLHSPTSTPARVFRPQPKLADSFRVFTGVAGLTNSSGYMRVKSGIRTTSGDYETEIILGNDLGVLDSFTQGAFITDVSVDVDTPSEGKLDPNKWHFRGSRPNGNILATTPSTTGDPRSNSEQLAYRITTDSDRTRFKAGTVSSTSQPGESTLTQLNTNFVDTSKWIDPSNASLGDAAHAPAVVANAPMVSIGELGYIYDPARLIGASGDIRYSRGGGRSLHIGRPERFDATTNPSGLWDGNSNSLSREWTSWRLVDIFSTTDSLRLEGRININSANRDGAAALKAALYGYKFQTTPDSDPSLATKEFDSDPADPTDKINELVRQLQARLKNDQNANIGQFKDTIGPFFERGELSEMPIFSVGHDLHLSVDTATTYDRGREELFRRLAELITTRGDTFTVYAVGQALVPQATGSAPVISATTQRKVTFQIIPVWNAGTPMDPYDPSSSALISARFKKPDKYAIKILYAGE